MSVSESSKINNVVIIGAGPAGLTAAIYAARANLKPLVIKGFSGGQLTQTPAIENWPGIESISGIELVNTIEHHAKSFGTAFVTDEIVSVDFSGSVFKLNGSSNTYLAKSVIIATGSVPKHLEIPSEQKFQGLGVSYCATCDGAFYRNQDVAVIGGGNSALVEALHLATICNKVYLVHRRDEFRAEQTVIDRVKKAQDDGKIELVLNSTVKDILGDDYGVNGVITSDKITKDEKYLKVTGVFVAIGHTPMSNPFKDSLETENGTIKTGFNGLSTQTSVSGIFAAGDCADDIYRQAITSAGTGAKAAIDAFHYLNALEKSI